MRRRTCIILALFIVLGGGYLALRWMFLSMWPMPKVITDVRGYAAVLKEWSESGLVNHFPAVVPAQAGDVRFSAYPGGLQAGAYIQLRMQLRAEEVRQIELQHKQAATQV